MYRNSEQNIYLLYLKIDKKIDFNKNIINIKMQLYNK